MRIDMAMAYLPDVRIDDTRLNILRLLVDSMADEEMTEMYDDPEEWREDLREAVERLYASTDYWGEVYSLQFEGMPYALAISGGLSFGEPPSEAFVYLVRLMDCEPVWERLDAWARADEIGLVGRDNWPPPVPIPPVEEDDETIPAHTSLAQ